jgi:hypothetical protein
MVNDPKVRPFLPKWFRLCWPIEPSTGVDSLKTVSGCTIGLQYNVSQEPIMIAKFIANIKQGIHQFVHRAQKVIQDWLKPQKTSLLYFDPQPIQYLETYDAYAKRISQEKKSATTGDRWTTEDEALLLELLDAGATQIQLSYAFPTRRWWLIRHHIKVMRGKGIKIPEIGLIQRNETFADYLARIGMTEDEYTVTVLNTTSSQNYPMQIKSHTAHRDVILVHFRSEFPLKPLNVLTLTEYKATAIITMPQSTVQNPAF